MSTETITVAFTQGLAFGVVNSLHCAGMCGPLAAFFLDAPRAAIGYHAARTLAYTAVGLGAGSIGAAFGAESWGRGGAWLAIVLAVALLLFAAGVDKHLGRIPGAGRLVTHVVGRTRGLTPQWRATVLGALTPLLPCGLLYAAVSAALVAGGTLAGGASMLGFALGLLPLLAITQANLGWLHRRFGHDRVRWFARIAMVGAAAMLLWRGALGLAADDPAAACPLCEAQRSGDVDGG